MTMGRQYRSGPPGKLFQSDCCWPDCNLPSAVDVPLCNHHLLRAWRYAQETLAAAGEALAAAEPPSRSPRQGFVYFIRFGERVKIGFTTNVSQRLGDLPHDEVLGVVAGTMDDERRCHAAFSHLRVVGEWFEAGPDLLEFIGAIASAREAPP